MNRTIGIDVRDDTLTAVVADTAGTIVGRDMRAEKADHIGFAVRDPLDAAVSSVIQKVTTDSGVDASPRIVSRGVAVALAEQWCGAARGARLVATLTIDDAVYAGFAIEGRPFEGAHGFAGAAGWLALNPVEREDYRKMGCLEAEIGLSGIVRRLIWRIKAGDHSRVLDAAGGELSGITARHVFDSARAGDGVAISVVRDTGRYIGMAIANLVTILDPDLVVVGGTIAEASDLLLEPARTETLRRLPAAVGASLVITPATLGADGPPLGAARAALSP